MLPIYDGLKSFLVQTSMQIYTAVILGMLKLEPCVQA